MSEIGLSVTSARIIEMSHIKLMINTEKESLYHDGGIGFTHMNQRSEFPIGSFAFKKLNKTDGSRLTIFCSITYPFNDPFF